MLTMEKDKFPYSIHKHINKAWLFKLKMLVYFHLQLMYNFWKPHFYITKKKKKKVLLHNLFPEE